jgi:hypothetical protein
MMFFLDFRNVPGAKDSGDSGKTKEKPMASTLIIASANDIIGSVTAGSSTTLFGPVGAVNGSAPPAGTQTNKIASFERSYKLDPAAAAHATLAIDAKNLVDSVSSPGIGVDTIGLQSTSDIAALSLDLVANPLSALAILGLSLSATLIHSDSNASYIFGVNRGFLGGDASFGSFSIGGALIGKTLTFAGDAGANTVLFKSPSVTITLDKQVLSDFLPPVTPVTPGGPIIPVSGPQPVINLPNRLTTDAIDIQLNNAKIFGTTYSGDITIGQTSATLVPTFHLA